MSADLGECSLARSYNTQVLHTMHFQEVNGIAEVPASEQICGKLCILQMDRHCDRLASEKEWYKRPFPCSPVLRRSMCCMCKHLWRFTCGLPPATWITRANHMMLQWCRRIQWVASDASLMTGSHTPPAHQPPMSHRGPSRQSHARDSYP